MDILIKRIEFICEKYKMNKNYSVSMKAVIKDINFYEKKSIEEFKENYLMFAKTHKSQQKFAIVKLFEENKISEIAKDKLIFEREFDNLLTLELKESEFIDFKKKIKYNLYFKIINSRHGNGVFSAFLTNIEKNQSNEKLDCLNVFSFRCGKQNEHYKYFIDNKLISVTWDNVDNITGMNEDELRQYAQDEYDQSSIQFNNMVNKMNIGDIVLIIQKNTKLVDVAVITSEMMYDINADDVYSNYRKIEILKSQVNFDFVYSIQNTISKLNKSEFVNSVLEVVADNKDKYNQIINNINNEISNEHDNEISLGFINDNIQLIIDGAPGTGKSYYVENNLLQDSVYERVTFYPDYEYHNFVGTILPVVEQVNDERFISYEFIKGHFTKLLDKALSNPSQKHFLVIEELTRGNAAAIFGDVFQLLDRNDDGWSEYSISNDGIFNSLSVASKNALETKYNNSEIGIPANMSIVCTVNSSDQNVFPLDTAFKRRFDYQIMGTSSGVEDDFSIIIGGLEIKSWNKFYQTLNRYFLQEMLLKEDKQIGPYFVKNPNGDEKKMQQIQTKLAMYLWNDINKVHTSSTKKIFNNKVYTLSDLNEIFIGADQAKLSEVLSGDFKKAIEYTNELVTENEQN